MWFNLNDKDLRQIEMLLPELGQRLRSEQASNSEPARQDYPRRRADKRRRPRIAIGKNSL